MITHYDPHTGISAGTSPEQYLDGEMLIPAYATPQPAPAAAAGYVAVYRAVDDSVPHDQAAGAWSVVEDHRGETYWLGDTVAVQTVLGPLPAGAETTEPLALAIERALAAIDQAAGAARARHITCTNGQESTYVSKAACADAYRAAGYPADTTAYPWIAVEAQALDLTPQACADAVIAQRDAWVAVGVEIEAARLQAKRRVGAADSAEVVNTIVSAVCAALAAL